MALKGNAAFIVTLASGQELVYPLNAPLRDLRPRRLHRRFSTPSLDYSAVDTKTIGGPAYELVARCRFADQPQDLLDLLGYAAAGAPITYVHDLTTGEPGYDATLMLDGDAIELAPDPDRFAFAEYDVTVVLRRSTPFTRLLGPRDVLFRYRAGAPWPGPFERPSDATYIDRYGVLQEAVAEVPRIEWLDPTTPTLLLEYGATNLVRYSEPTVAQLNSSGGGVTDLGPAHGFANWLALPPYTSESVWAFGHASLTQDVEYTVSVYLRTADGTAPPAAPFIFRRSAGASIGAPDVVRDLGGGLWRAERTFVAPASQDNASLGVLRDATTGTQAIHVTGLQVEEGPVVTSLVRTTGAPATRGADTLRADSAPPMGALVSYERFVEGGTLDDATRLRWQIGASLYTARPTLHVISSSTGDRIYRLRFRHPAGDVITGTSGLTRPAVGEPVEHLASVWWEGDTLRLRLDQSIDGGPVETVQASQAGLPVPAAWAEDVTYHTGGVSAVMTGRTWLKDWVVLRYGPWTLDAARRRL